MYVYIQELREKVMHTARSVVSPIFDGKFLECHHIGYFNSPQSLEAADHQNDVSTIY